MFGLNIDFRIDELKSKYDQYDRNKDSFNSKYDKYSKYRQPTESTTELNLNEYKPTYADSSKNHKLSEDDVRSK